MFWINMILGLIVMYVVMFSMIDGFADFLSDDFGAATGGNVSITAGRNIHLRNVTGSDASITASGNGGADVILTTGAGGSVIVETATSFAVAKHRARRPLQALTRVNRTYNHFRYGYVVDFADIRQEFDATNKAYFEELQAELGDEMEHYSRLFKSADEIREEIEHIKDVLFSFDTENAEIFTDQISQIQRCLIWRFCH